MNGAKGKEKAKKKTSDFEFCKVCNRNHEEGSRHKYFPNHSKSLSAYLTRFQRKLADIRFFLKNPSVLRPEKVSGNRFWCVFCDSDVHEVDSSFACANAINHLASEDHLKNLKHFLWKYGGGMDRVDTFRILESDVAKWEKKCETLKNEAASSGDGFFGLQTGPLNDIHNKLENKNINNFENHDFGPHNSNISNGVMPLQYYTNEYQISCSGLPSVNNAGPFAHNAISSMVSNVYPGTSIWDSNVLQGNWNGQQYLPNHSMICSNNLSNVVVSFGKRMMTRVNCSQGLQNPTQLSNMDPEKAGENVHTGAPPPWFEASEVSQPNAPGKLTSSSFISRSNKSGKSSKLNPKRVGAAWAEKRKIELEMEKRGEIVRSDCDTDWLPNFGRVWQSGSRKESRKEFEKEKQKLPKSESHFKMPVSIQPYISKRMRKDANE